MDRWPSINCSSASISLCTVRPSPEPYTMSASGSLQNNSVAPNMIRYAPGLKTQFSDLFRCLDLNSSGEEELRVEQLVPGVLESRKAPVRAIRVALRVCELFWG
jgi:hypothetical protein